MSNQRFYIRNPEMTAIARRDAYLFVRPGRDSVVMSPVDTSDMSDLLDQLLYPMSGAELEEYIDGELLDFLLEKQILIAGTEQELMIHVPRASPAPGSKPFRHLVFGLTGAIYSVRMGWQLFQLARGFCERVDVILTESAQKILRPEYLEYMGLHVWTDAFESAGEINVPHIHLARTAEMVVVMPASAHTLYKLAHGTCSDLLSLTIAATTAPVVLVPAMNPTMWANPAVARNVAQLREDGMYVVAPRGGIEVSRPTDDERLEDIGGGAGIPIDHLPAVLASILSAHRSTEMD